MGYAYVYAYVLAYVWMCMGHASIAWDMLGVRLLAAGLGKSRQVWASGLITGNP